MIKARKNHICTLCHGGILKGTEYINHNIRPWDHPNNETFSVYKAHKLCDLEWRYDVGPSVDWVFPADQWEWAEWRLNT